MNHNEAIEMMASEKYLLDELTPVLREAYEEHYFGCTECALDVQTGAAFIDHARTILPEMASSSAAVIKPTVSKAKQAKRDWFAWLRPAIMVPAFGCLLAIVGYQNLVVYPALEIAATEPRVLPTAAVLHDATRGGNPVIYADLLLGSTITVELPTVISYESYKFEFYNSKGDLIWTRISHADLQGEDTISLWLPGGVKQDTYKIVVSGITSAGGSVPIKQQMFDLRTKDSGAQTK